MTKTLLGLTALSCLLLPACGGDAPATTDRPGTPAAGTAPMADDHGEPHPLGSMTIGAHTFTVVQSGDVEAGHDMPLDLEFPQGAALPTTVRAWIGVESGKGSRKTRLDKEGDRVLHQHVDAPDPIPEGSKIWIEIEADGKTQSSSIDWHR